MKRRDSMKLLFAALLSHIAFLEGGNEPVGWDDGEWHHFVAIINSDKIDYYVDGKNYTV